MAIILLTLNALLICDLCHFVVLMAVKSANWKIIIKEKNLIFQFENTISFLELSCNLNIHNSCDNPKFCYNYVVNPKTLNDIPCTFFKR